MGLLDILILLKAFHSLHLLPDYIPYKVINYVYTDTGDTATIHCCVE